MLSAPPVCVRVAYEDVYMHMYVSVLNDNHSNCHFTPVYRNTIVLLIFLKISVIHVNKLLIAQYVYYRAEVFKLWPGDYRGSTGDL